MRIKDGHIKWPSFFMLYSTSLGTFRKKNEDFFKKIVEL